MKPVNSDRWIESMGAEFSEVVMKFLPLPGGEGRGEGERKCNQCLRLQNRPFVGGFNFWLLRILARKQRRRFADLMPRAQTAPNRRGKFIRFTL